jgi:hypothetical protein
LAAELPNAGKFRKVVTDYKNSRLNTIDSLDPSFKSFEPLHQPKHFPGNIRQAVENYKLLPHELKSKVQYVPCHYKADAVEEDKFTCEVIEE